MLRITQNSAPVRAKSYYTATADYYTEGQELVGIWRGQAAKRLGLVGEVQRPQWEALCDNRDPATGEPLTPRQKQDRRVGYDFNFHVPKSVSVLYGLTGDDRILEAFRDSVDATMDDIEAEMQTRVRAGGKNTDRTTGNMAWGEFIHFTARPVNGVPDPHLHAHCFVFNTTWDAAESRWKAGQFAGIKRDGEFYEAVFHSRLAHRMVELGLPVLRTKQGWELAGVPQSAIKKFSRRTALIEEEARTRGITDPAAKGELGAITREEKSSELTMDELRAEWAARLSDDELESIAGLRRRVERNEIPDDDRILEAAVAHAVGHCFERNSVVPERRLIAEAMKRSVGAALPESVTRRIKSADLVIGQLNGRSMATTKNVLAEERRIIEFARQGRGVCQPLAAEADDFKRDWLNEGQKRAVRHVLKSRDRVIVIRGGAGTGKTTMMKEAVEAIEASGHKVFAFAPSADASRGVLRQEGFADADTVARLLKDEELQAEVAGAVIWIDEAGLLGSRTMREVFDLADRLDCRVILSGDRSQHGAVERGAALRLLEEEAGLRPADIREIQRQRGDYKNAVRAISDGRVEDGFRQLDKLGWVREVNADERYHALASDYVATVEKGKTAMVVSPTHLEAEKISREIRGQLKASGRLGSKEHCLPMLVNANLTEAERADSTSYDSSEVLVFHQNAKGFRRGQRVEAGSAPLPLDQANRFQVFRRHSLPIAAGELLRITRNGTTADGEHRLNNGAVFTVKGLTPSGDIRLTNGWTIDRDYGHLAHGYVSTSHASQGKTVDQVLIGQSSDSLPASSRQQFYVSISRGRDGATIYTDDKEALLDAVRRSEEKLTATEFTNNQVLCERAVALTRASMFEYPGHEAARHLELEEIAHDR